MPTTRQDSEFRDEMVSTDLLDKAIAWIAENLTPEEVFTVEQVSESAGANSKPGDVFPVNELEEWATGHGYVKEEPQ